VAVTAEFVAKPLVTARHISLNAQEVRVSRHGVDLAGKPWNPEGVDDVEASDHDIDRNARGQVKHTLRSEGAISGVAERPDPLPCLCFDPQRLGSVSRQEPLTRDQRVGDERRQNECRQA